MNAEEHQAMLEGLLERSLSLREHDFGLPDFGQHETAASELDLGQDDVEVDADAKTVPDAAEIVGMSGD